MFEFLLVKLACFVAVSRVERYTYNGAASELCYKLGLADCLFLRRDCTSRDLGTCRSYPALEYAREPVLRYGGAPVRCHTRTCRCLWIREILLLCRPFSFVALIELLEVSQPPYGIF